MSFLSFLLYFRNNVKNHKYILFNVSIFVSTVHFSFHSLFSFLFILWNIKELLTYAWHTVKSSIAFRPCGFDPFSLYAITKVSRKPKHTLLTRDFKTYTFRARFSVNQTLAPLPGMGTVWFHVFVYFLLCFWCAGQIFSIVEVHTCFCVVG